MINHISNHTWDDGGDLGLRQTLLYCRQANRINGVYVCMYVSSAGQATIHNSAVPIDKLDRKLQK